MAYLFKRGIVYYIKFYSSGASRRNAPSAPRLCRSLRRSCGNSNRHRTGDTLKAVALAFYRDVLGFQVTQRYGDGAIFLSAGGYHHHIGLNTWQSASGSPPPRKTTGLYHFAILYPSRPALADALRRVMNAGIELDGASDHGVSEALYLRDPDENGVELYWDRPRSEWPRDKDGAVAMYTRPLDVERLLREPS